MDVDAGTLMRPSLVGVIGDRSFAADGGALRWQALLNSGSRLGAELRDAWAIKNYFARLKEVQLSRNPNLSSILSSIALLNKLPRLLVLSLTESNRLACYFFVIWS